MTELARSAAPSSRRGDILRAALACFSEVGYASATVDDVRRRAGASVGSMYHHFAGKEQLAAALLVDGKRAYYAAWLESLRGRRSAEQGVRTAVRGHFNWVAANVALGRFLFGFEEPAVADAAAHELRAVRAEFQVNLLTWLRPHIDRKAIQHLPDDVYEPLWMAPAQSFTRQWVGWDNPADLAPFHRHFADAAWASLQAT